jgi:Cof subfamily protein (haloacid dehalogenase superfamily)
MENSTPDIKLIVVDLDGTLLSDDHTLSEKNKQALLDATAAGVPVVLATGKTRKSAESLIAALNLNTPGVFVQGLVIYNADGTLRYQQTLEAATARRVITFAEDRGFGTLVYSGNRILIKAPDSRMDEITKYGEPQPELVGPIVNILTSTPIHKVCFYGDDRRIKALRWQLEQQVGGQVAFTMSHVAHLLEVLPPGASKGKGVRLVAQEMGILPEHVMAIGDGENDLEMIKFAGLGIAVENAAPLLKQAAKVVVSSNNAAGVAEAIERYVLAPRRPAPQPVIEISSATPENTSAAPVVDAAPPAPTSEKTSGDDKAAES